MHTFNMKMKTNVQYIANATFAKLPDVSSKCKERPDNNKQTNKNREKVNHFDR